MCINFVSNGKERSVCSPFFVDYCDRFVYSFCTEDDFIKKLGDFARERAKNKLVMYSEYSIYIYIYIYIFFFFTLSISHILRYVVPARHSCV